MGGRVRIDFRTLFGLRNLIDRRTYLATGVGLMVFKYLVDATFLGGRGNGEEGRTANVKWLASF